MDEDENGGLMRLMNPKMERVIVCGVVFYSDVRQNTDFWANKIWPRHNSQVSTTKCGMVGGLAINAEAAIPSLLSKV